MNARNWLPVLSITAIGVIAGLSLGCGNNITVAVGPYKKVILYPSNGDTVKCLNFAATFQGPNPCEKQGNGLSECKINIPAGHYRFNCDTGCVDPEIEVGSIGTQNAAPAAIPPPDTVVVIWCDQGSIHVDPSDAPIKTGKEIAWENDGSPNQAIPNWTVTPATFCADPTTSINKDHPSCNVGAPNKYTYTVKANPSTSCSDASATVTVTP